MNSRHPLEEEVFAEALRRSAEERVEYVEEAVRGDGLLRRRVELLLAASDEAEKGKFLDRPAAVAGRTFLVTTGLVLVTEKPGDRIGRYKLLEQIGEGGCGVVYVAEQEAPIRRRVALKVIKLGMDTRQVVARFEAERQALALMDHPNIAKVLDGGSTSAGRPYFVMELIRGIRITDFCDQNNVSTEDRLKLFIQVCQAVQHAHQKGIIHRDIKPSNVLVTLHDGVPVPKVIDFGIAKATTDQPLTDKTVYTAFEQFLGTPAYMSPEQAEMSGLDIDTRSDIYALGVLLYELLTGTTPFDARDLLAGGLEQMRRTIREKEPVRPSTRLGTMLEGELTAAAKSRGTDPPKLLHHVRGDLDWIVMKALEKDRTRRYETVNGLAADVKRHLGNEAVIARPPSRLYRLQKLIQRNRVAVGAASAVVLALVAGLVITTRLFLTEREAHRRAATAERAGNQLRLETELRRLLSEAVEFERQNQPAEAELAYRKVLVIQTNLYGAFHSNMIPSFTKLGHMVNWQEWVARENNRKVRVEKLVAVEKLLSEALAFQRALPDNSSLLTGKILHYLGDTLELLDKLPESEKCQRESLAIQLKLPAKDNPDLFWTVHSLNFLFLRQGKLAEIDSLRREAAPVYRAGAEEGNSWAQGQLARMYAKGQGVPKNEDEAAKWYRKVWEIYRQRADDGQPSSANALAWFLATRPIGQLRDGKNAVLLAEKAVSATGGTNEMYLDTLAAAFAETGQFEKAVEVQKAAIALLKDGPEKEDYRSRLRLFESNTPYRTEDP